MGVFGVMGGQVGAGFDKLPTCLTTSFLPSHLSLEQNAVSFYPEQLQELDHVRRSFRVHGEMDGNLPTSTEQGVHNERRQTSFDDFPGTRHFVHV